MVINKPQALQIQKELEELIKKYGLFAEITHKLRPGLKEIHVKDISIKVN